MTRNEECDRKRDSSKSVTFHIENFVDTGAAIEFSMAKSNMDGSPLF